MKKLRLQNIKKIQKNSQVRPAGAIASVTKKNCKDFEVQTSAHTTDHTYAVNMKLNKS